MRDQKTSLNAICPYFTMFPLNFPLSILNKRVSSHDWVMDPFCGRGTVAFASRILGLSSIAIDSNPVAVAITEGKIVNTSPESIVRAANQILEEVAEPADLPSGEFWNWAFHKDVLRVVCRLREGLLKDCRSKARKALRAILLGALHGPQGTLSQSYLSNQSPRTFSPKPRYAVNFWKVRNMRPVAVDVMNIISSRASRYYETPIPMVSGIALHGDSRDPDLYSKMGLSVSVKWIITSPPYFGIRTYIPDQWLRLWLLGGKPQVDYSTDGQLSHSNTQQFSADLRRVWINVANFAAPNARMVIRMGGINSRKADHRKLIKDSLYESGWTISTIKSAGYASQGKRQAQHLKFTKQGALGEYDIWARRERRCDATMSRPESHIRHD